MIEKGGDIVQNNENSSLENKTLNKRKKIVIIVAIVMLSICTMSLGAVFAKYISEKNSTGEVIAAEFYFTSNLLDGKEHTLAPNTTSVTFTLGNHPDDLRFSNVDIEYTVTINKGATVNKVPTVENATGTIVKGSVKDAEVTISNLEAGTYTITAKGTGGHSQTVEGGYTKTLTAIIVIPEKNYNLYYEIDTSVDEYILLTVWNEGESEGTVTIAYTGIPDNTNSNMTGWLAGDKVSQNVTIEAHGSKVFRFFGGEVIVTGATEKAN